MIVSDEIHCPIVLDGDRRHVPIACLDPAIERRSISLFAPTKAYNFPGLAAAVAVIPDPALREAFESSDAGLLASHSPLGLAALTAAYEDTSRWLERQNAFLAANADLLERTVDGIEGIRTTHVEGTYLAWLDVSALGLDDPLGAFAQHGLGLHDGPFFGGPGFLRFNFACPRSILDQALDRLASAGAALRQDTPPAVPGIGRKRSLNSP